MTTPLKSDFLNILQARGFLHQCSNLEGLDAKLCEGPQVAYVGADPTGPSLHAGHLIPLMMLRWFEACGHRPVALIGGATALIGDPTGKDKMRPFLSPEETAKNIESLSRQYAWFLKTAQCVNNADWLKTLGYMDFLRDYGPHFSINRMLTFDSVKTRLEREQSLSLLEFNYMLFQAYDFVELNRQHGVVLQMGGSDQWGNIVCGVDLGRRVLKEELFALTCPLLTTASGKKMGKTENGAVWLNADMLSPYDYYQFWRNTEDSDVGRFLKLFTLLPMDEIRRLESLQGSEINEAKKTLAFEATALCHGPEAAQAAQETARVTFEQGGTGADLPSVDLDAQTLAAGVSLVELLRRTGLSESNGEARRLIRGGGVRINGEPASDEARLCTDADLSAENIIKLSAGKKRHALVRIGS